MWECGIGVAVGVGCGGVKDKGVGFWVWVMEVRVIGLFPALREKGARLCRAG